MGLAVKTTTPKPTHMPSHLYKPTEKPTTPKPTHMPSHLFKVLSLK